MRKAQKILLHGSRVPHWAVFCVLLIEYVCLFYPYGLTFDNVLLFIGYGILVVLITCNNHGQNVRIRYEQELSLLLKCVLTNMVFAVFGAAVFVDLEWSVRTFLQRSIWLTILQLCSIVIMCIVAGQVNAGTYNRKRLYIYEDNEVDIVAVPGAKCVSVRDMSLQDVEYLVSVFDEVYLYDLSARWRNDLLKICFEKNMPVYFTTKLADMELRGASLAQDGESPIFYKAAYGMGHRSAVVKRLCDIVLSGAALVLLAPLFAFVAIAIKGEDGGDVFYRQTRCTKGMRNFEIIKFRSMIMGAEEKSGPQIAGKKDERMTRVGYVLRKFKIDELPQLINIFRGDMSFVGPRPERPEIIAEIVEDVPEYTFRTTVPAGLTGYAQVHGDYHTEFLDKLKWDLMYIENHSLMLDLKIILMTVPVVLRGSDDV